MNSHRDVDHLVIGLGGLGSGALYWLRRLADEQDGATSVVGLEQFELGHLNGASHDHSRIIRHSYHTPGYVRLAAGAYDAWAAVEAELGESLIVRTGGIDLFPAGAAIPMDDYTTSMDAVGVPYETWGADEVRRRYPQFHLDDDVVTLFQADTGIAPAARGTAAHQRLAVSRGAEAVINAPVEHLTSDGAGEITVVAGGVTYRSGSVTVTADGWTNELLAPLGVEIPLEVTREQVVYYSTPHHRDFAIGSFPVWIWMDDPSFYGFPEFGEMGMVKAAEDVGGQPTTARTRTFDTDQASLERMGHFLERTLPGIPHGVPKVTTCLYTLTKDRDFVLDTVPGHPGLQVALGAGHGFKFASWFGRTLAERSVHGSTDWDLTSFRFGRPALTDPNFVANYLT
jgi:sarcosine oxidase